MKRLLFAACIAGILPAFAASTTYVVPAGTDGNTPEAPYDSWEKAANDPRAAADALKLRIGPPKGMLLLAR